MPGSGALKRPAFSEFPGLASKPKSENCRLLPREQAKEGQLNMPLSPAPQPQSNPVEGVPEHSPARILVADDSVISQRAALRMLDSLGLRADASANGREAVEMLLTLPYDLVLMDCQMPLMNGLEAASEIRRREPPDRHTPIVGMTAETGAACLDDCLASGIDDRSEERRVGKECRSRGAPY